MLGNLQDVEVVEEELVGQLYVGVEAYFLQKQSFAAENSLSELVEDA